MRIRGSGSGKDRCSMSRPRKLKSAPVGVVTKVLRILEVLDRAPAGLPLKDIAEITSLNKSTAHRFVTHLEGAGYLFRDENKAYMIGPKLVRLGSGTTHQTTLCRISRPILDRVWKITGETVNLAVLDGREIFYVDVQESIHRFRFFSQVGMRRPLHCTALGKAILSKMQPAALEGALRHFRLEHSTPKTVANLNQLRKDLAQCAARGYALDDEEVVTGARCIGAAILDGNGKVAAGISISGPVARINRDRLPLFARMICTAAADISRKLGYEDGATENSRVPSEAQPLPKNQHFDQDRRSPFPGNAACL
jgi:DNA-binding IclR family transcriptional regulator